jgi:acyl transferase domain-containing protein
VILKRLDRALADGDHIHAVIAHSGINQDGKTSGISVPSGEAQAALIKRVYAEAGLNPAKTVYVEAHGTVSISYLCILQAQVSSMSMLTNAAVYIGDQNR